MKSGQVLQEFSAKGGYAIVLGTPRWKDSDDLLEPINSVADEGTR